MTDDQHPTPEDRARFWLGLSKDMAVARRIYAAVHRGER